MTVVGVVLILVAVVLLGLGLVDGSSALLTGSVALSLLATVMVVVGARQAAAARVVVASPGTGRGGAPAAPEPTGARAAHSSDRAGTGGPGRPDAPVPPDERSTTAGSAPPGGVGAAGGPPRDATAEPGSDPPADPEQPATPAGDAEDEFDDDPPDEPAPQAVSAADAAKVARMSTEVLVIDGRPRYHLPGCVHLLGRESQSLPVSQAVEWDFTPCSLCEPDNALLT